MRKLFSEFSELKTLNEIEQKMQRGLALYVTIKSNETGQTIWSILNEVSIIEVTGIRGQKCVIRVNRK